MRNPLSFPITSIIALGACALLASCLSTEGPKFTGPTATHWAAVEGKVTSLSGEPVSNAVIGGRIPSDRSPLAYYAPDVQSQVTGEYQLVFARTADVGPLPPADTLSVWVVAVNQVGPDAGRRDSLLITLQFHPIEEQGSAQHLDLTLAIP